MKKLNAFTMLELVFVIVIIGIIGKFGVEFMTQAYQNYMFSSINNRLQADSSSALEFITKRLQYRIKDSLIARDSTVPGTYDKISNAPVNTNMIEWISADIDGYRGTNSPYWSGVIDLDNGGSATMLSSPLTDTTSIDNLISALQYGGAAAGMENAALYYVGAVDMDGFWDGNNDENNSMLPLQDSTPTNNQFIPAVANGFSGTAWEYYQLAWTAYAIVHEDGDGDGDLDLVLYYDYQPWNGGDFLNNARTAMIMQNVSTFRFGLIGSMIKVQICVQDDLVDDYSICKEKVVF